MKSISSHVLVFTTIISGIAFSLVLIFSLTPDTYVLGANAKVALPLQVPLPQKVKASVPSANPTRITIPKINVSALVEAVGTTSNGAMAVPVGPDNAAWFELGPRPGEAGSAVIAGHEGWKNNIPAVFDNLHKLAKGDKVYIQDEKGAVTVFMVRDVQVYGKNVEASNVFDSTDGKVHLNLITCEGVWNKVLKSYSGRLVVFTDKIYE